MKKVMEQKPIIIPGEIPAINCKNLFLKFSIFYLSNFFPQKYIEMAWEGAWFFSSTNRFAFRVTAK